MRTLKTSPPGTANSNSTKVKSEVDGRIELTLYAPKDVDPDLMQEMVREFPLDAVREWIVRYNYWHNLIIVDPT